MDKEKLLDQASLLIVKLNIKRHNLAYKIGYDNSLIKRIDRIKEKASRRLERRSDNLYGEAIEESINISRQKQQARGSKGDERCTTI